MINEIEQWKRDRATLDRLVSEIYTMLDGYDEKIVAYNLPYYLRGAAWEADKAANLLSERIKSRETLRAQLQDSLSQATDGGKGD